VAKGYSAEQAVVLMKAIDLSAVEFVDGDPDGKAISASVEAVTKTFPPAGPAPGKPPAGGADFGSGNGGSRIYSAKEMTALVKTDPKKWAEVKDDYLAAMNDGRVRD
jgi:hypothetical protein